MIITLWCKVIQWKHFFSSISIFHAIGHLTATVYLPKFLTKEGFLNDFKCILVRVKEQEIKIALLLICKNNGQACIISTQNKFRAVSLLILGSMSRIGIIPGVCCLVWDKVHNLQWKQIQGILNFVKINERNCESCS